MPRDWGFFMLRRLLLLFAVLVSPAQAITLQAVTEYPASAMPGEGLTTFARRLEALTQGSVTLEARFDGGAGLKSISIIAAVQQGQLQVGDAFAGSITSLDPVLAISSLPFLATSTEQARRLAALARPAYEAALERQGQKLLYVTPWPPSGLWSALPVSNLSDFTALSIRAYDATGAAVLSQAGAKATNLSFADAMPKLKDGSVNAVLSSGDGGAGRKLWDYTRHFIEIGYAVPLSFTTISTSAFNTLDKAQQAAVLQAAQETEAAQWRLLENRQAKNYATMRENGVTITPSPADLNKALATAAATSIAAWEAKAGPEAAEILRRYRAGP